MSRYIEYHDICSAIDNQQDGTGMTYEALAHAMVEIQLAPSIDIVKCKECKHWIGETEHYEDREYKACWQLCGQYVNSEFWCKYGEREGE